MMLRENNPLVQKAAINVDSLLSQSIASSRTLTAELSPYVLHEGGLAPAMEWLAKWMNEKHGLTVKVEVGEREMPSIKEDVVVLLFQSVRELLFNAVKHAKVKTVRLDLTVKSDRMKIVVSDKGAGFDPSQLSTPW